MASSTLISELRRRIKDQHPSVHALTVGVTDSATTRAILEITSGRMVFVCAGGSARPFDISLHDALNGTVGRLHDQLQRMGGMVSSLDKDADPEHPAADLESFGPKDIRQQGIILRHRTFSDGELEKVLAGAVSRHNPSLNTHTLPQGEWELVFLLSQAAIARERAQDASKRKGTSESVADLLAIARDLESTYQNDFRRLNRVLQPARESSPNSVHQGDVMVGTLFRRSLRTGYLSPSSAALPPSALVLLEPDDLDDGDTEVRVRWGRSTEPSFLSCELWMDTQPEVVRQAGTPQIGLVVDDDREVRFRETTSRLAGKWVGPNATGIGGTMAGPVVENSGQLTGGLIVPGLEPETDYYFRIYVFNVNGEYAASEVVRHTTKPLRVRFSTTTPVTPSQSVGGVTLTFNFDGSAAGAFTTDHKIFVGGKEVVVTRVSGVRATAPAPTFVQKGTKDIVVVSPTGLKHLIRDGYTAL